MSFSQYWVRRRNKSLAAARRGLCIIEGKRRGRLVVLCASKKPFVILAKSLGGVYRERTRSWVFPPGVLDKLQEGCKPLFREVRYSEYSRDIHVFPSTVKP